MRISVFKGALIEPMYRHNRHCGIIKHDFSCNKSSTLLAINSSASDSTNMESTQTSNSELLFGINEENLAYIREEAKDYAILNGILMRTSSLHSDVTVPLPFCIAPSRFPEKWFKLACELQTHLNLVLFQVSLSKEFLKECLASAIEADEFTANIFKIFEFVENENKDEEQLSLGLIRSDYLLDCDSEGNVTGMKQVESNTISASFGGVGPRVRNWHEYILQRLHHKNCKSKLPINKCVHELAKGLLAAWKAYGKSGAYILYVTEDVTLNICDQRALEHAIYDIKWEANVMRCSFKDLRSSAKLKEKALFVNDKEVAVVYYRTGYMPDQYEPEDWEIRLLMERSKAIKCPSAGLHLAGTKRVQVFLTRPGILEKFVAPDIAESLRQVFVHQYSLDLGEEGDQAIALGVGNPEKYVLKPEREGGGNNIYGTDIKDMLEIIKLSEKRKSYILMQRINPPSVLNCFLQYNKEAEIQNVICELGTYGVILGSKKGITVNNFAGHILRSKGSSSNETGVAAGFGALDSPYIE